eukprot:GHRR01014883.1.p1 GENE.GHRR01014883.1~~GHRR01014883.1.p1  ORF type:complete len:921 (+),score=358.42 GHRR01014883.1:205-2967(+)
MSLEDRYLPADHGDYKLTREESRRHSHKHGHKHKKRSKRDKDPDCSENKSQPDSHAGRSSHRHASEELEDGEIVDAGVDGEGQPRHRHSSDGAVGAAANGLTNGIAQPDAVNGGHRSQGEGSNRHEAAAVDVKLTAADDRQQCQHNATGIISISYVRDSSRDRHKSHSRPNANTEATSNRQGPAANKDHTREPSKDNSRKRSRERSRSRRADIDSKSVLDYAERDRQRQRGDDRHSSRKPSNRAAGSDMRSDSRQDKGRYDWSDRGRLGRYDLERYEREMYRDSRDMGRQRNWDRQRDRGREVRGSDPGRDRDRRRRSRSRSRERLHKHSRNGRDRHERLDCRRSEEEPELDLDPNGLLNIDPLGPTAAQQEEVEERRRLEESRKRRQAILAKHQQTTAVSATTASTAAAVYTSNGAGPVRAAALPAADAKGTDSKAGAPAPAAADDRITAELVSEPSVQQQQPAAGSIPASAAGGGGAEDGEATPEGNRSSSDDSYNAPGSPAMNIWNTAADGEVSSRDQQQTDEQATSQLPVHDVAADNEPNLQSERLRVGLGQRRQGAAIVTASANIAEPVATAAADDMFAAEDDMFAAADSTAAETAIAGPRRGPAVPAGLTDNYDDAEGYYNFQVGEVLDGRYEVFACKGKGVFSTVLRARDLLHPVSTAAPATLGQASSRVQSGAGAAEYAEVAIKVIRSNETMSKAAALEQRILRLLCERDPDNKKHVVRLLRTFEYRQHVCLVFEPLDMNLRELTLKYGRNVGLNITAVAIYASQLLVALRHLQQCRVLHADIKPDNILVNARRTKVKICDLGSAMLAGENERTPYLVSRFYRAPEVILGLAYDFAMDMWSIGCVLYELFTGKILFPGRTNNEMLKLMMDVKGPFPKKMLKKGIFVEKHFEDDAQMVFSLIEEDPVTKQPVR